jgi:hypothetical protein
MVVPDMVSTFDLLITGRTAVPEGYGFGGIALIIPENHFDRTSVQPVGRIDLLDSQDGPVPGSGPQCGVFPCQGADESYSNRFFPHGFAPWKSKD